MAEHTFGFRTRALHAGGTPDAEHGARAVPIYQTTSFVFKDTDDAANLFSLQKYGNVYSRLSNPTVAALEERIASLEGGIGAVATASGMAAEFITFAALCQAGDHIVASSQLYGGTVTQLDVSLRRFGIETTFVEGTDPADYKAALTENTKAIYTEVVANPSGEVADLEGLAEVAHEAGIPLVVLGGKEYGSGSSRDWAAKGTALLGVRAVITESFERIHRSNLIGMGVVPLQFPAGESAASLGLDGTETFSIRGLTALNDGVTPRTVAVEARKADGRVVSFDAVVRIDTPGEADYFRNGGILQYVLRQLAARG